MKKLFALGALLVGLACISPALAFATGVLVTSGATLGTNALTLLDWSKRLDPDGQIPIIAELLTQTNMILQDAIFMEGNLPTGHRVTIRTGLPTVYWRLLNQGIPTSKSTTAQVDEAVGIMEARCHIDVELAKLNGNTAEFRLSEDRAFLEAMNQLQAQTMIYGNAGVDPKTYTGLAVRYGTIAGAGNSANILDAGGTGSNNTSVYLVVWGDNTVFCPFPKGSKAGLQHQDLGEQSVPDANGNFFQALRTLYQWKNGLVVKDWRYVVRICNINVTDLTTQANTQAPGVPGAATQLINLMSRATDRIPAPGMGKAVFYANRTVMSMLKIAALNKSNAAMGFVAALNQTGNVGSQVGQYEFNFMGIPLRQVDRILVTESRVV